MIPALTVWYWVGIPVGLALYLHVILVCVNYDLNGFPPINSRLHARLDIQLSYPIPSHKGSFLLLADLLGTNLECCLEDSNFLGFVYAI